MGAARVSHGTPGPATPMTRACGQRSRRPWRWGRLVAAGLALVLVAPVVPGARADDGQDGGMSASWEPAGAETLEAETLEAETVAGSLEAESFQAQTPVAAEGADGTGGDTSVTGIASAEGEGAGGRNLPAGGKEPPQPPAPAVVAEHQPGDQQPGDQQHAAATGGSGNQGEQAAEPDQAGQDKEGGDPAACAHGSCSEEPSDPGGSTVAAAGGWRDRLARWGEMFRPGRPPQEAAQPSRLTVEDLALGPRLAPAELEREIDAVREGLRGAGGGSRTGDDMQEDSNRIELIIARLERLQLEQPVQPEQSGLLEQLMSSAVELQREILDERFAYAEDTRVNRIAWGVDAAEGYIELAQGLPDREHHEYMNYISRAQQSLDQAAGEIGELESQMTEETPESDRRRLTELMYRVANARGRMTQTGENLFIGEEVDPPLTPGRSAPEDNQIASLPGFKGEPKVPDLPGFTGLTDGDQDAADNAGFTPAKVIPPIPPFPATFTQKVSQGMSSAMQAEATTVQEVSSGMSPRMQVAVTLGPIATVATAVGLFLFYVLSLHPKVRALDALASPEVLRALPWVAYSPPPGA
jgi:hypothetical protein